MHVGRLVSCIAAAGLALCVLTAPQARADAWNQKTIFTFGQPVEIPGQVLPAGTYVFKLMESPSDRNIVQVFDRYERHLYGTFLAIANYRLRPTGKVIITFQERAAGAPQAIRAWFYPGDNYGHELVYHKHRAQALAKANRENVVSMPEQETTQTDVSALKQQPLTTQQPSETETQLGEEYTAPPQQAQAQPEPQANREAPPEPVPAPQADTTTAPAELPHTGSELPVVALAGVVLLAAAGSLRLAAARMK